MASCQTSRWVSTAPYVVLTVTQSESTDTAVTLSWTLQYKSDYAASTNGVARAYTVKIGGSVVKEDTYNINGVTGTKTIASGTKVINKTTAAQTIAFSVSFAFNVTWSGTYGGTKSASGSISVAAKASYTIAYNANGGSGAPASQTKWHGTNLTISSTKPTRTGYKFEGWALSKAEADAGTWYYTPGSTCGQNKNLTLYAVWEANTYKVTYNANGGSLGQVPASQTKTYGVALALSSNKPTRTNYNFKGWGTSASATTATYAAGASYTANAAITLYAVWELAYTKPRIVTGNITRCTSDGTPSDTGTYILVKFNWGSDRTISSVKIEWKLASSSTWTNSKSITSSGTSGTVSEIIGGGLIDIEKTYTVRITVTDAVGSSTTSIQIPSIRFTFDALPGNEGAAVGKPAELKGYFDVGYKTRNRDSIVQDNHVMTQALNTSGKMKLVFEGQNTSNNTTIGYGNYYEKEGNTHVYGYDIYHYVSNIATPGSYRPYIRRGESFDVVLRTAGYVTNAGKDVCFTVPVSRPIIGAPTITVTSVSGFTFRQGAKYTHGSTATVPVVPTKYTASYSLTHGIVITASFSDTTNVTNNDAIGIHWSGKISFT